MASICTHRKFYTETLLHTEKILLTANFYTHFFLYAIISYTFLKHKETFLYIITTGIAAPKPDLGAKAKK